MHSGSLKMNEKLLRCTRILNSSLERFQFVAGSIKKSKELEDERYSKYGAETAFCDWGSLPMDHMRTAGRFLSRATSSFSVCKCAASNP